MIISTSLDQSIIKTRRSSHSAYVRKGRRYTIEEIFPLISRGRRRKKIFLDGDLIYFNSMRLLTFKRFKTICTKCGIEGVFFVKEKHKKQSTETFHLNLYAYNKHGSEVLMTSDHIIPKAKKGSDGIRNRQPMCIKCNAIKSDTIDYSEKRQGKQKT